MKRLILVTSPPASGKTFVSRAVSKELKNVVYLDKDSLIPLSKRIFEVAGEEYNRSSDFFYDNIRDAEYEAIVGIALEALEYANTVLINAPFTKEIRDSEYIESLKERLQRQSAQLLAVWIQTDVSVCRRRMEERGSERDKWKIQNFDEYIMTQDFSIPDTLGESLFVFHNSDTNEFEASMERLMGFLNESEPSSF